jgi:phosphoribosylformimino-5-aminoimidazole carboxamide ribotide isomerase
LPPTEATRGPVLFPAIDLRHGRCVRLERGEAERETVYGTDPFRVAEGFARDGAEWLHVVDLDAAFGDGSNRALIARIAAAFPLRVQTGGGLRTEVDLEAVLGGGAARAVIGTAAVESPALVEAAVARWGADRIAVGLDARGRRPAIRGWREETGEDLFDLAASLAGRGVRTLIYTDIDRDGMLSGPNVETSAELARATGVEVIVSGGVGAMHDLDAVAAAARREPGIAGVIVGKALYEGRIDLAEAVRRMRA